VFELTFIVTVVVVLLKNLFLNVLTRIFISYVHRDLNGKLALNTFGSRPEDPLAFYESISFIALFALFEFAS
jgi:hypothetical protein